MMSVSRFPATTSEPNVVEKNWFQMFAFAVPDPCEVRNRWRCC